MSREPDLAKREVWRRRLVAFDRGRSTVAAFCDRVGVSVATFYQWRRKLTHTGLSGSGAEERAAAKSAAQPGPPRPASASLNFLPVEIVGSGNGAIVEVQFSCGTRVLVPSHDHGALRLVLETLASERRGEPAC